MNILIASLRAKIIVSYDHMVSFLQEADTVQSLHLSLREKEEELGRAMKEHLHMASALPTKVENHRCGLHECVVV